MNNNNFENNDPAINVHPPDSLVKFESPLFVGVESLPQGGYTKPLLTENVSKLDEMINSMLPAR